MERVPSNQSNDQASGMPPDLLMLLTTVAAVDDELERARLTATAIPSLVSCSLSGMALREERDAGWKVVLQTDGLLLPSAESEKVATGLEPLYQEAVRRANFLVVRSEDRAEGLEPARWLQPFGMQCLVAAPIVTLRSELGMLLIGRRNDNHFSKVDEFLLRTLAQQLAISSENLRLHQELQRHTDDLEVLVEDRTEQLRRSEERQRVLLEINNAIITNLDRASLFGAVAEALGKVVAFDRAGLTEYDAATDTLEISALTHTGVGKKCLPKGRNPNAKAVTFKSCWMRNGREYAKTYESVPERPKKMAS